MEEVRSSASFSGFPVLVVLSPCAAPPCYDGAPPSHCHGARPPFDDPPPGDAQPLCGAPPRGVQPLDEPPPPFDAQPPCGAPPCSVQPLDEPPLGDAQPPHGVQPPNKPPPPFDAQPPCGAPPCGVQPLDEPPLGDAQPPYDDHQSPFGACPPFPYPDLVVVPKIQIVSVMSSDGCLLRLIRCACLRYASLAISHSSCSSSSCDSGSVELAYMPSSSCLSSIGDAIRESAIQFLPQSSSGSPSDADARPRERGSSPSS